MSFVRAANPVWYFVDLVGIGLNDEYYAFFLTNTLPYLPQAVFRDPQGLTAWPNPLEFFPNGTLPDNLYFDPSLVYRIEIRHGNSQTDPLIYEINNFVPGNGSSSNSSLQIFGNENEISNGQFSEINFTSPLTITTAGTYSIAPGWDLVLTGGPGTTTITQFILSGTANEPTNPPYFLRISNSGWSGADLVQRFENNGALWAGGAVTMSVLARGTTTNQLLSLIYAPNPPGVSQTIKAGQVTGGGSFQVFAGAIDVDTPSLNSTLSTNAYVDMIVRLPTSGSVDISNIQVIGQSNPLPTSFTAADIPPYQQDTNERMIDHLFHLYRESTVRENKNSILTGWYFPLNPWQFATTTVTNVAVNEYGPDQTILIQQNYVSAGVGNNISIQRATFADNFNLQVNAVTATNEFGIIQYIDPATIRPYWGKTLSSLVKAYTTSTQDITVKMRLFYRTTVPAQGSTAQNVPILSWASNGDPVFSAGFTEIIPRNDPSYTLNATNQEFPFEGMVLPASAGSGMTLGIFLYTTKNMTIADSIFINDVSLTDNEFAIATQSQTFDQVLSQCQYYYEKSFDNSIVAGVPAPDINNAVFAEQSAQLIAGNIFGYPKGFGYRYNTIKRAVPILTFYDPNNQAPATIFMELTTGAAIVANAHVAISVWTLLNNNTHGFSYRAATEGQQVGPVADAGVSPEAYIRYHFTADSTIG